MPRYLFDIVGERLIQDIPAELATDQMALEYAFGLAAGVLQGSTQTSAGDPPHVVIKNVANERIDVVYAGQVR